VGFFIVLFITGWLNGQNAPDQVGKKYWIFFRDKGTHSVIRKADFQDGLDLGISQRALRRRAKVRSEDNLIDEADLPVAVEYIDALKALGVTPRAVSRWVNGVSAVIPQHLVEHIDGLPFVERLHPVATFNRKPVPVDEMNKSNPVQAPNNHVLNYGSSYTQNSQIHVPEVHDLGITGRGVLVGLIDTGFDYKGRATFSHIDVVAEHDFHWNDDNTANEDNDPTSQHNHGTFIFSVIGGFHEGRLVGTAYGASYALAKTEWVQVTDLKIEEDHWIMGIEWLEGMGADVVSSSLGYATFVDAEDYTMDDLDGNTALVTQAADMAARNGVVVLTSAGNKDFWEKITFPADGHDVIAVGAVNGDGSLWVRSSGGPTTDGRIKPDVVAMGNDVYYLSPSKGVEDEFSFGTGTSFSSPLAAGVCALILQAHPELNPYEVRDALRETADRADSPDNQYGWGLVNAYEAIFYHGIILLNIQRISMPGGNEGIEMDILSKTGSISDSVFICYSVEGTTGFQEMEMTRIEGAFTSRFRIIFPPMINLDNVKFYVTAADNQGEIFKGPYGAPDVLYGFSDSLAQIANVDIDSPEDFQLLQNYPNPFNSQTTILFDVVEETHVTLRIYNILGQQIHTLINAVFQPGRKRVVWSGTDRLHRKVPSGLYVYRLETKDRIESRKMILVN